MWSQLCRFWFEDVSYLDDWTRLVLFGSIFFYIIRCEKKKSPFLVAKLYTHVPSKWIYDVDSKNHLFRYIVHPAMHFMRSSTTLSRHQLLTMCVYACQISWWCVIVGFGGRYSMISLTFSLCMIYGLEQDVIFMTHKFHCILYTCFALCFASDHRGPFSVDYYVWPGTAAAGDDDNAFDINRTGFGCKLANVFLVFTLFSAGVCKVRKGLQWLNGERLYRSIHAQSFPKNRPTVRYYAKLMKNYQFVYSMMAVASLVLEFGSVSILVVYAFDLTFTQTIAIKLCIAATFVVFHQSIRLMMAPNFTVQCLCYLVFLPFSTFSESNIKASNSGICASGSHAVLTRYMIIGTALVFVLFLVMLFKLESFPFSVFSMYSKSAPVRQKKPQRSSDDIRQSLVKQIDKTFSNASLMNTDCMNARTFERNQWLRFKLFVYDEQGRKTQIVLAQCWKKKAAGFNLFRKMRRRKDALNEIFYRKYKGFKFPMVVYEGYFVGDDRVQQFEFIQIKNYLKIERYLQGIMQLLQSDGLLRKYDVYARNPNGNDKFIKGCRYEFVIKLIVS